MYSTSRDYLLGGSSPLIGKRFSVTLRLAIKSLLAKWWSVTLSLVTFEKINELTKIEIPKGNLKIH